MEVSAGAEHAGFTRSRESAWLAYGTAACLNLFAIVGAWRILDPGFSLAGAVLTLVGMPMSIWLRRAGAPRRTINLLVLLGAVATAAIALQRAQLPGLQADRILSYFLFMREGTSIAILVYGFLWVAVFRSFTLLEDEDLPLCIIPAASTMILASIVSRTPLTFVAFLGVVTCAAVLLALDYRRRQLLAARAVVVGREGQAEALRRVLLFLLGAMLAAAPAGLLLTRFDFLQRLAWSYNLRLFEYVRNRVLEDRIGSLVMPYPVLSLGERAATGERVLFRVRCEDDLYWRLDCFDLYTGRDWQHSRRAQRARTLMHPQGADGYQLPATDAGPPGLQVNLVPQVYEARTFFQGALPVGYEPVRIRGRVLRVRRSDEGVIFSTRLVRPHDRYRVDSLVKGAPPAGLSGKQPALSAQDTARYLQLPPLPSRVTELAARLTRGGQTATRKAFAILGYLRDEMSYATQVPPPPPDRDGVDWFLFDTRRGYCDYFAAAMVVLCRSAGVPARLATGYLSGHLADDGWYEVRQKDAHSWAEVFITGYGWLALDPTPARAAEVGVVQGTVSRARAAWQRAKSWLAHSLLAMVHSRLFLPLLAALSAALMLAWSGVWWLRRERLPVRPRTSAPEERRRFAIQSYQALVNWLARWGYPKPMGATAAEYLERLQAGLGEVMAPAAVVVARYQAARYGRSTPSAEAVEQVAAAMTTLLASKREIKRAIRAPAADQPW